MNHCVHMLNPRDLKLFTSSLVFAGLESKYVVSSLSHPVSKHEIRVQNMPDFVLLISSNLLSNTVSVAEYQEATSKWNSEWKHEITSKFINAGSPCCQKVKQYLWTSSSSAKY